MIKTLHLLIKGKVQGVFFRASAKKKAEEIGIGGWTKNTREGDVEIVCSGEEERLTYFLEWCKSGPPDASVDEVIIDPIPNQEFNGFEIRR